MLSKWKREIEWNWYIDGENESIHKILLKNYLSFFSPGLIYLGIKSIVSSNGNGFRIAPSKTGRGSYNLDEVCDDASIHEKAKAKRRHYFFRTIKWLHSKTVYYTDGEREREREVPIFVILHIRYL